MSVENILAIYSEATNIEKENGVKWYKEAREFCHNQAKEYGVSLEVVVGVLSALSPRNKWNRNLIDTVAVLEAVRQGKGPESVKVCTFNSNKQKAFDIVTGHAPNLIKKSNKTAAFFDNILFENSEAVTVDVWAFGVYMGIRIPARSFTNKQYKEVADTYIDAAKKVGIKAYELQAVCWGVFQRLSKNSKQIPLSGLI